jgi:hypothetical protein
MKAEKATVDVLAILESNGISDDSEIFGSSSDQDTPCESKVGKKTKQEESSVISKVTKYKLEEHSGSGHDFSSSQGRNLSWKGRKHSPRSLEKCKDPSLRRRSSFASTSSSPKHHQGKSCRQVRNKESRLVHLTSSIIVWNRRFKQLPGTLFLLIYSPFLSPGKQLQCDAVVLVVFSL